MTIVSMDRTTACTCC